MKILYLTMAEIDESSGVYKKICAQTIALRKLSHKCDILFISDENKATLYEDEKKICLPEQNETIFQAIKKTILRYELCYVRFELLRHKKFKFALDCCKKENIDLIVEIPTYPPYQESIARVREKVSKHNYISALRTLAGTVLVIFNQKQLVDRSKIMCIVADDIKFRNKVTVRIENGVDLNANPYSNVRDNDTIRIIAVSNFATWNGYDRAIYGLKNYIDSTGNKDIRLVFVGDKKKGADLIQLSMQLDIEDYIEFTGLLSGENLDKAYSSANVGLGALGNHRRKVFANSSLKAKEYAARGLIMILAKSEGIENEIMQRSFVVPSDESPIDFVSFAKWYKNIISPEIERRAIREFAIQNYSWEVQMEKVINAYSNVEK